MSGKPLGTLALAFGVDRESVFDVHLTIISSCHAFVCIMEQSRCVKTEFLLDETKAEAVLQDDTYVPQPLMGIQSIGSE